MTGCRAYKSPPPPASNKVPSIPHGTNSSSPTHPHEAWPRHLPPSRPITLVSYSDHCYWTSKVLAPVACIVSELYRPRFLRYLTLWNRWMLKLGPKPGLRRLVVDLPGLPRGAPILNRGMGVFNASRRRLRYVFYSCFHIKWIGWDGNDVAMLIATNVFHLLADPCHWVKFKPFPHYHSSSFSPIALIWVRWWHFPFHLLPGVRHA